MAVTPGNQQAKEHIMRMAQSGCQWRKPASQDDGAKPHVSKEITCAAMEGK